MIMIKNFFWAFQTGFYYVAQAGLELMIFLSLAPWVLLGLHVCTTTPDLLGCLDLLSSVAFFFFNFTLTMNRK
jgi:hypothetical protein